MVAPAVAHEIDTFWPFESVPEPGEKVGVATCDNARGSGSIKMPEITALPVMERKKSKIKP